MANTPTTRTLNALRKDGFLCGITEKWNAFAGPIIQSCSYCETVKRRGIRQDLFNFIDIIAIGNGEIIGVQCTSYSNHSARKRKIMDNPDAISWADAGGKIEVWSWKKRKLGKSVRYDRHVERLYLESDPF